MALFPTGRCTMLLFIFTTLSVIHISISAHPVQPDAEQLFEEFVVRFNKSYSPQEWTQRFLIFKDNMRRASALNKQQRQTGGTATFSVLTPFADLTPQEFARSRLMPPRPAPKLPAASFAADLPVSELFALPTSLDWRQKGAVTAVKDQGSAGTCWSFSTTGSIEAQWFLAGNSLISLSEEQLVDCDSNDCGVFGGWPYLAMEYVISAGGIQSESDFPYCSGDGGCYPCMANKNKTFCGPGPVYCNRTCNANPSKFVARISNWTAISSNETQIAAQLVQRGPLSVCLDASTLQLYHGGVWDPLFCSNTELDHAVLIVGYGVEDGIFGKKDYWLVKNSWGQHWGEEGYFKIIRGKGKCGINTMVVSAEV